jgi:hypothetical protein
VALLRRLGQLLDPRGRIVVELAAPGTGFGTGWAILSSGDRMGPAFRWSVVGADVIDSVARDAGFETAAAHRFGDRWCAVLEAPR